MEAGNTLRFSDSFSGYPASSWTADLTLGFDTPVVVSGTTSGAGFLFEISAATSATFAAGLVGYTFFVYSGSERTVAREGVIQVLPNRAAVRIPSTAERILAELDATLEALAGTADMQSVSFNGQSYTTAETGGLRALRVQLQAEVIRERNARLALSGAPDPNVIRVKFV